MLQKRPYISFLKAIALFTAIVFITESSLAYAQGVTISDVIGTPEVRLVRDIQRFAPPADLGTVDTAKENGPFTVVLIQDAHGQEEAQRHIKAILDYLSEKHHFKQFFFEGASAGNVSHHLLRFFQNDTVNQKVADAWLQKGLVTGPGYFLLETMPDVKAFGLEDPAVYDAHLTRFRKVYEHQAASEHFLGVTKGALEAAASRTLNLSLRKFVKEWLRFRDNQRELLRHVQTLERFAKETLDIDLRNPIYQPDYPQLIRLAKIKELDAAINRRQEAIQEETRALAAWLKEKDKRVYAQELENLTAKGVLSRDGKDAAPNEVRAWLERLYQETESLGLHFGQYPHLVKYLGRSVLISELDAMRLFREIETLTKQILDKLTQTGEERALLEICEEHYLLSKLLALELTREEWEKVKTLSSSLQPGQLLGRLKASNADVPGAALPTAAYQTAIQFYEMAVQRETGMVKQLEIAARQSKEEKIAIVAGGFHAGALQAVFQAHEWSYINLLPKMRSVESNDRYLEVMLEEERTGQSQLVQPTPGLRPISDMDPVSAAFFESKLREVVLNHMSEQPGPAIELHGLGIVNRSEQRTGVRDQVLGIRDQVSGMTPASLGQTPQTGEDLEPIPGKEMPKNILEGVEERLGKHFPLLLKLYQERIKEKYYAQYIQKGAITLTKEEGHYHLYITEAYQDLDPNTQSILIYLHLVDKLAVIASEAKQSEIATAHTAGLAMTDVHTDINTTLTALILQAQAYYTLTEEEKAVILSTTKAGAPGPALNRNPLTVPSKDGTTQSSEPEIAAAHTPGLAMTDAHPDINFHTNYTPVLNLFNQFNQKTILDESNWKALIQFLREQYNLDSKGYDPKQVRLFIEEIQAPLSEDVLQTIIEKLNSADAKPEPIAPYTSLLWHLRVPALINQIRAENDQTKRFELIRQNFQDVKDWVSAVMASIHIYWFVPEGERFTLFSVAGIDVSDSKNNVNHPYYQLEESLKHIGVLVDGLKAQLSIHANIFNILENLFQDSLIDHEHTYFTDTLRFGRRRYQKLIAHIKKHTTSTKPLSEQETSFLEAFVTTPVSLPELQNKDWKGSFHQSIKTVKNNKVLWGLQELVSSPEIRQVKHARKMVKRLRFTADGKVRRVTNFWLYGVSLLGLGIYALSSSLVFFQFVSDKGILGTLAILVIVTPLGIILMVFANALGMRNLSNLAVQKLSQAPPVALTFENIAKLLTLKKGEGELEPKIQAVVNYIVDRIIIMAIQSLEAARQPVNPEEIARYIKVEDQLPITQPEIEKRIQDNPVLQAAIKEAEEVMRTELRTAVQASLGRSGRPEDPSEIPIPGNEIPKDILTEAENRLGKHFPLLFKLYQEKIKEKYYAQYIQKGAITLSKEEDHYHLYIDQAYETLDPNLQSTLIYLHLVDKLAVIARSLKGDEAIPGHEIATAHNAGLAMTDVHTDINITLTALILQAQAYYTLTEEEKAVIARSLKGDEAIPGHEIAAAHTPGLAMTDAHPDINFHTNYTPVLNLFNQFNQKTILDESNWKALIQFLREQYNLDSKGYDPNQVSQHLSPFFDSKVDQILKAIQTLKEKKQTLVNSKGRITGFETNDQLQGTFTESVSSTAFSPDGNAVIAGSEDKTFRIYNLTRDHEGRVTGFETNDQLQRTFKYWVRSTAFSPDSKAVIVGSRDHTFRIYNLTRDHEGRITGFETNDQLQGTFESAVWSTAFSPDGNAVIVGGDDNTFRIYNLTVDPEGRIMGLETNDQLQGTFEGSVSSIAFSPDGNAVIAGSYDNTFRIYNLTRDHEGRITGFKTNDQLQGTFEGSVWSTAFSPDGKAVIAGSYDNTFRIYNLTRDHEGRITGFETNDQLQGTFGNSVWSTAFSPDSKAVIVGSRDHTFRIYNLTRDHEGRITRFETNDELQGTFKQWVRSTAFSPDGNAVIVGGDDKTFRIYNLEREAVDPASVDTSALDREIVRLQTELAKLQAKPEPVSEDFTMLTRTKDELADFLVRSLPSTVFDWVIVDPDRIRLVMGAPDYVDRNESDFDDGNQIRILYDENKRISGIEIQHKYGKIYLYDRFEWEKKNTGAAKKRDPIFDIVVLPSKENQELKTETKNETPILFIIHDDLWEGFEKMIAKKNLNQTIAFFVRNGPMTWARFQFVPVSEAKKLLKDYPEWVKQDPPIEIPADFFIQKPVVLPAQKDLMTLLTEAFQIPEDRIRIKASAKKIKEPAAIQWTTEKRRYLPSKIAISLPANPAPQNLIAIADALISLISEESRKEKRTNGQVKQLEAYRRKLQDTSAGWQKAVNRNSPMWTQLQHLSQWNRTNAGSEERVLKLSDPQSRHWEHAAIKDYGFHAWFLNIQGDTNSPSAETSDLHLSLSWDLEDGLFLYRTDTSGKDKKVSLSRDPIVRLSWEEAEKELTIVLTDEAIQALGRDLDQLQDARAKRLMTWRIISELEWKNEQTSRSELRTAVQASLGRSGRPEDPSEIPIPGNEIPKDILTEAENRLGKHFPLLFKLYQEKIKEKYYAQYIQKGAITLSKEEDHYHLYITQAYEDLDPNTQSILIYLHLVDELAVIASTAKAGATTAENAVIARSLKGDEAIPGHEIATAHNAGLAMTDVHTDINITLTALILQAQAYYTLTEEEKAVIARSLKGDEAIPGHEIAAAHTPGLAMTDAHTDINFHNDTEPVLTLFNQYNQKTILEQSNWPTLAQFLSSYPGVDPAALDPLQIKSMLKIFKEKKVVKAKPKRRRAIKSIIATRQVVEKVVTPTTAYETDSPAHLIDDALQFISSRKWKTKWGEKSIEISPDKISSEIYIELHTKSYRNLSAMEILRAARSMLEDLDIDEQKVLEDKREEFERRSEAWRDKNDIDDIEELLRTYYAHEPDLQISYAGTNLRDDQYRPALVEHRTYKEFIFSKELQDGIAILEALIQKVGNQVAPNTHDIYLKPLRDKLAELKQKRKANQHSELRFSVVARSKATKQSEIASLPSVARNDGETLRTELRTNAIIKWQAPADQDLTALLTEYYQIKETLRDSFIRADSDGYRRAYRELQQIENKTANILSREDGRAELIRAAEALHASGILGKQYNNHAATDLVQAANRSFADWQKTAIEESSGWLTRHAIDLEIRCRTMTQEMISVTQPFSLSRFIPDSIPGREPSEGDIAKFQGDLNLAAYIEALEIRGMAGSNASAPHAPFIMLRADLGPGDFRGVFRHEGVHYLAGTGDLPIPPSNEIVTTAVSTIETVRAKGYAGLKQQAEGHALAVFNRGRELFADGGSIIDFNHLLQLALGAMRRYDIDLGPRAVEQQEAIEEAVRDLQQTVNVHAQATAERIIGELAAGYLWQKAMSRGIARAKAPYQKAEDLIDQDALDQSIFDFARQVVALESPRMPTPQEIAAAKEKMNGLLERIRLLTRDPSLELIPWTPLWPGDRPTWRYLRDEKTGTPLHQLQFVPEDIFRRDEKTLRGFVYQEVFRALYSFPVLPEALRRDVNLWALWSQLETARVIPIGLERWRGVKEAIRQLYDDRFALAEDPLVREAFQRQPLYVQYLDSILYEWHYNTGSIDPRVKDERVKQALNQTRALRQQAISAANAGKHLKIIQDKIYPLLKELLDASKEELTLQRMYERAANEQGVLTIDTSKNPNLSDLDEEQKASIKRQLENMTAGLSEEERAEIQESIERELKQAVQREAQQNGSQQMPDDLQPMLPPESSGFPNPEQEGQEHKQTSSSSLRGNEQNGAEALSEKDDKSFPKSTRAKSARAISRPEIASPPSASRNDGASSAQQMASQASQIGEEASQMAQAFGELSKLAEEAKQAAGNVAKQAGAVRETAGTGNLSQLARDLSQEASQTEAKLSELTNDARGLDRETQQLTEQAKSLNRQSAHGAEELKDLAERMGAHAAALRSKAETALERLAKPLKSKIEALQGQIDKQEDLKAPNRIQQQAHEAEGQAEALLDRLQELKRRSEETEQLAKQVSEAAQALSEKMEQKAQTDEQKSEDDSQREESQKEGKQDQSKQTKKDVIASKAKQSSEPESASPPPADRKDGDDQTKKRPKVGQGQTAKDAAKKQERKPFNIRPVPEPPDDLKEQQPPDVPKEEKTVSTQVKPQTDETPQSDAEKELEKKLRRERQETQLTAEEQAFYQQYLDPIRHAITSMKSFLTELFEPIKAALLETGHQHGRLDSRRLTQAVTQDNPRAFMRKRKVEIPNVRWSLIVDISGSMLAREDADHTKLDYAAQTGILFAESLHDLPGHESEFAAFADSTVVLKKAEDEWNPKMGVHVLGKLFGLDHGSTDDVRAIKQAIKRAEAAAGTYDEHIIFVVSDGESTAGLGNTIDGIRAKHPHSKIFGVGIGDQARDIKETYAPLGIWVPTIKKLPKEIERVLRQELLRIVHNWQAGSSSRSELRGDENLALFGGRDQVSGIRDPQNSFESRVSGLGLDETPETLDSKLGTQSKSELRAKGKTAKTTRESSEWAKKAAEEFEKFRLGHEDNPEQLHQKFYEIVSRDLDGGVFKGEDGPRVPKVPIYGLAQNLEVLRKMERAARRTRNRLLYLWGPHGGGKNYMADLFAMIRNQGRTLISSHEDMTVDEVFEKQIVIRIPGLKTKVSETFTAIMGAVLNKLSLDAFKPQLTTFIEALVPPETETKWILTEFAEALIRGDLALFDEFDQMPALVKAALNDALQERQFERHDGTIIHFHPNALVWALSNPVGDGNVAQSTSGEAVDRFTHINVLYLPPDEEIGLLMEIAPNLDQDIIKRLVDVATEIREAKEAGKDLDFISTRELVMLVRHLGRFPEDQNHIPYVFRQVYMVPDNRPDLETDLTQWLKDNGFKDKEPPALTAADWSIEERAIGVGKQKQVTKVLRIGNVEMPILEGKEHVPSQILKDYEKVPTNLRRFQDLMKAFILGQNILLEGDPGTGKDWITKRFASALGYPLFTEAINEGTHADDLLGHDALERSAHVWKDGKLALAVKHDGILNLNELNRGKSGVTASINNFLQNRYVTLRNGMVLDARRAPHMLVIASINPNRPPFKTYPMTPAQRSRYKKFRYDFLPEKEEIDLLHGFQPMIPLPIVEKLVKAANLIRKEHRAGNVPFQVTGRTLEKVLEDLALDPWLYLGSALIENFLEAYGEIARGREMGKVIRAVITKILQSAAIGLDQIEQYQPVSVGDKVFDQLITAAKSASGKEASVEAMDKLQAEIRKRRLKGEAIPAKLVSTISRLNGLVHAEARPALDWAVRFADPDRTIVTADELIDRMLSEILENQDAEEKMLSEIKTGKLTEKANVEQALAGLFTHHLFESIAVKQMPQTADVEGAVDVLIKQVNTKNKALIAALRNIKHFANLSLPVDVGDNYLNAALNGFFTNYKDPFAVRSIVTKNIPSKLTVKEGQGLDLDRVHEWLTGMREFPFIPEALQNEILNHIRTVEALKQNKSKRSELRTVTQASLIGFREVGNVEPLPTHGEIQPNDLDAIKEKVRTLFPQYEHDFLPLLKEIKRGYYADDSSMIALLTLRKEEGENMVYIHQAFKPTDTDKVNPLRDPLLAFLLARELVAQKIGLSPTILTLTGEMALLSAFDVPFWKTLGENEQATMMTYASELESQGLVNIRAYFELMTQYAAQQIQSEDWQSRVNEIAQIFGIRKEGFNPSEFDALQKAIKQIEETSQAQDVWLEELPPAPHGSQFGNGNYYVASDGSQIIALNTQTNEVSWWDVDEATGGIQKLAETENLHRAFIGWTPSAEGLAIHGDYGYVGISSANDYVAIMRKDKPIESFPLKAEPETSKERLDPQVLGIHGNRLYVAVNSTEVRDPAVHNSFVGSLRILDILPDGSLREYKQQDRIFPKEKPHRMLIRGGFAYCSHWGRIEIFRMAEDGTLVPTQNLYHGEGLAAYINSIKTEQYSNEYFTGMATKGDFLFVSNTNMQLIHVFRFGIDGSITYVSSHGEYSGRNVMTLPDGLVNVGNWLFWFDSRGGKIHRFKIHINNKTDANSTLQVETTQPHGEAAQTSGDSMQRLMQDFIQMIESHNFEHIKVNIHILKPTDPRPKINERGWNHKTVYRIPSYKHKIISRKSKSGEKKHYHIYIPEEKMNPIWLVYYLQDLFNVQFDRETIYAYAKRLGHISFAASGAVSLLALPVLWRYVEEEVEHQPDVIAYRTGRFGHEGDYFIHLFMNKKDSGWQLDLTHLDRKHEQGPYLRLQWDGKDELILRFNGSSDLAKIFNVTSDPIVGFDLEGRWQITNNQLIIVVRDDIADELEKQRFKGVAWEQELLGPYQWHFGWRIVGESEWKKEKAEREQEMETWRKQVNLDEIEPLVKSIFDLTTIDYLFKNNGNAVLFREHRDKVITITGIVIQEKVKDGVELLTRIIDAVRSRWDYDDYDLKPLKDKLEELEARKRAEENARHSELRTGIRDRQHRDQVSGMTPASASLAGLRPDGDASLEPIPAGAIDPDLMIKVEETIKRLFPQYAGQLEPITKGYYADPISMQSLAAIDQENNETVLYLDATLKELAIRGQVSTDNLSPDWEEAFLSFLALLVLHEFMKQTLHNTTHSRGFDLTEETALFFAIDLPFWLGLAADKKQNILALVQGLEKNSDHRFTSYIDYLQTYVLEPDVSQTWDAFAADAAKLPTFSGQTLDHSRLEAIRQSLLTHDTNHLTPLRLTEIPNRSKNKNLFEVAEQYGRPIQLILDHLQSSDTKQARIDQILYPANVKNAMDSVALSAGDYDTDLVYEFVTFVANQADERDILISAPTLEFLLTVYEQYKRGFDERNLEPLFIRLAWRTPLTWQLQPLMRRLSPFHKGLRELILLITAGNLDDAKKYFEDNESAMSFEAAIINRVYPLGVNNLYISESDRAAKSGRVYELTALSVKDDLASTRDIFSGTERKDFSKNEWDQHLLVTAIELGMIKRYPVIARKILFGEFPFIAQSPQKQWDKSKETQMLETLAERLAGKPHLRQLVQLVVQEGNKAKAQTFTAAHREAINAEVQTLRTLRPTKAKAHQDSLFISDETGDLVPYPGLSQTHRLLVRGAEIPFLNKDAVIPDLVVAREVDRKIEAGIKSAEDERKPLYTLSAVAEEAGLAPEVVEERFERDERIYQHITRALSAAWESQSKLLDSIYQRVQHLKQNHEAVNVNSIAAKLNLPLAEVTEAMLRCPFIADVIHQAERQIKSTPLPSDGMRSFIYKFDGPGFDLKVEEGPSHSTRTLTYKLVGKNLFGDEFALHFDQSSGTWDIRARRQGYISTINWDAAKKTFEVSFDYHGVQSAPAAEDPVVNVLFKDYRIILVLKDAVYQQIVEGRGRLSGYTGNTVVNIISESAWKKEQAKNSRWTGSTERRSELRTDSGQWPVVSDQQNSFESRISGLGLNETPETLDSKLGTQYAINDIPLTTVLAIAKEVTERILRETDIERFGDGILKQVMPEAYAEPVEALSNHAISEIALLGAPRNDTNEVTDEELLLVTSRSTTGSVVVAADDPIFQDEALFRDLVRVLVAVGSDPRRPWLTIAGERVSHLIDAALKDGNVTKQDLFKVIKFTPDAFGSVAIRDGQKGSAILAHSALLSAGFQNLLYFVSDTTGLHRMSQTQKVTAASALLFMLQQISSTLEGARFSDASERDEWLNAYFTKELPGFALESKGGLPTIVLTQFWQYLETLPAADALLRQSA